MKLAAFLFFFASFFFTILGAWAYAEGIIGLAEAGLIPAVFLFLGIISALVAWLESCNFHDIEL